MTTLTQEYDDEYNEDTRPRLNWTAISRLSSVDRIDTHEVRTLLPNLLWSRVSRGEIRGKTDANLSKAFRALQLCGEIFHSVARNAGEELVSRDKSLKEMSQTLRTSAKQLRKISRSSQESSRGKEYVSLYHSSISFPYVIKSSEITC